jgi:hypothetical protein
MAEIGSKGAKFSKIESSLLCVQYGPYALVTIPCTLTTAFRKDYHNVPCSNPLAATFYDSV